MPGPADSHGYKGGYVPLVEVWRGDVVESVHHGAVAVADDSGRVIAAFGDPEVVTFLRSSAKPVQAMTMVASGAAKRFGLSDAEIAVVVGSHAGEAFHLEAVRSILQRIGLDEEALRCGTHAPFHRPTALRLRADGRAPTVLHNNCSGKHAGMLAQAVMLGAPIDTYLRESHPVQVRIREALARLCGLEPGAIRTAVDGCSAPTFAVSLRHAAMLFARLMRRGGGAAEDAAVEHVVDAMRSHPEMVAGTDRLCSVLMALAGHGLIAKIGAEGFYCMALQGRKGGIGIALKVADGDGRRARPAVAIETLRRLGVLGENQAAELRPRFCPDPVSRRGRRVGRLKTCFDLGAAEGLAAS